MEGSGTLALYPKPAALWYHRRPLVRAPTLLSGVALALLAAGCSYDYDTPFRCSNGVKDGDEVDTDCGGSCGPCGRGKHCNTDADCAPAACTKSVCGFTPVGYWQKLTPTASPPS